ncbi:MAG: DegT/DnrJ/EryC1/StrS family aminotransferase [Candidatus Helarchaeota archaeon]|nr:DegT/DnrJ/EryC1/StrS family aminotransferase [Candidatus Helarchaeota archaeon]
MIPVNIPLLGDKEKEAVLKVLESGMLTHKAGKGPMVSEFEKKFSNYIKVKHSIALNSGTAALHAALLALDIKSGDEVIIPSFTFVATASVALHVGAKPIFVDIDPEIYTMDPQEVEKVITPKTKAIVPVHLFGHPADLDPLKELAAKHDLVLIEDACQAHGALYKGQQVGSVGDIACFSFYPSKNMTTGEGGMLTANNDDIAETVRMIINHGEKEAYQTMRLGHNFRMPEVAAAIGTVQIDKLPKFIEQRRKNAQKLTSLLKDNPNIQLPIVRDWAEHSWYLFTIRTLQDKTSMTRDSFVKKMHEAGVGAAVYYKTPLHLIPYYKKLYNFQGGKFPKTEKAADEVVSLPVHPGVKSEQISFIGKTVNAILR